MLSKDFLLSYPENKWPSTTFSLDEKNSKKSLRSRGTFCKQAPEKQTLMLSRKRKWVSLTSASKNDSNSKSVDLMVPIFLKLFSEKTITMFLDPKIHYLNTVILYNIVQIKTKQNKIIRRKPFSHLAYQELW